MGNLLKVATCGVGCIYLAIHIAYVLTSAADSIRQRDRQAGQTIPPARSHTPSRDAKAKHQDTVGFERKTLS